MSSLNEIIGELQKSNKNTNDTEIESIVFGGEKTLTLAIPDISSSYELKLPSSLGSNGQVLQTDGSGNLSFQTVQSSGEGGSSSFIGLTDTGSFGSNNQGHL